MQWQNWISEASTQLREAAKDDALMEARLLAQCVSSFSLTQLRYKNTALTIEQIATLDDLLNRRLAGEPIAYLLGNQPFFGLNLKVTPATLIPRPETELLVEAALERLPNTPSMIADLGTGSGAIALAIAANRPDCQIMACDFSKAALAVAKENAKNLAIPNISFLQSNWFSDFPEENLFDMIISNPPYIDPQDTHLPALRHEPLSALISKNHGYQDLEIIIREAGEYLKEGGFLLMEHGFSQAKTLQSFAKNLPHWHNIITLKDYSKLDRITLMQKKSSKNASLDLA